jgi:PAS domain S-box-containing protein
MSMGRSLRVLIVEDSESDAAMLVRELKRGGYELSWERAETELETARALQSRRWDLVLSDYAMPNFSAEGAARLLARDTSDLPLIVVSGAVGEEEAAGVMRAGARDFILKKNLRQRLLPAIERELDAAQTRRDKNRADEKLDFERQLLRQLMEGTPDAIYFKDRQRRYIHLNNAERRLINVANDEEMIGKTTDEFIPPEWARKRCDAEERVLATGELVIDSLETVLTPNGANKWLSTTMAPIRSSGGDVVGLVGVARDVSEAKRQEQLKDEFIATVSHELRTPLTSITGAIACLRGGIGGVMADPAKRLLRIAHDNCQRLARIINDILDIGKIEAGQIASDPRQVSIAALIDQIIEANQSFADQYGISVRFERADLRAMVFADPHRLGQVISNLLSNAIKFSPHGGEVVCNTERAGDSWCITVRDRGVGIPDEYKERIFDRFVQVDATDARRKGGTGLGLSIAKQIVIRLNGSIKVEDAPGGGSIFRVTLPALSDGLPGRLQPEANRAVG